MTTNTMVAIQTQTLASNSTSLTFSSIPSTYTDLIIECNFGMNVIGSATRLQFNGDSGSNYSDTFLYGNGSSAGSSRESSASSIRVLGAAVGPNNALTDNATIHIQNYSNSTTYKSILCRGSSASKEAYAITGLWRNTAAITSLTLLSYNGSDTLLAGSTFTLYGIANADIGAYATGGIITQDATYYYHAFGSSGTFTPSRALTADILVVAGGGGGGSFAGGGGGAGGVFAATAQSLSSGTGYTCTVGAGGATNSGNSGSNGVNSTFGALTAAIGGGGGGGNSGTISNGASGGSGGGAGGNGTGSASGGSSTQTSTGGIGYGNVGGSKNSIQYYGAGGGGAGAVGASISSAVGGNGGDGTSAFSSWLAAGGYGVLNPSDGLRYIAGGGGGNTNSTGGKGGGGYVDGNSVAYPGIPNTGGGGGGNGGAGIGGSGLIIVRYAK